MSDCFCVDVTIRVKEFVYVLDRKLGPRSCFYQTSSDRLIQRATLKYTLGDSVPHKVYLGVLLMR